jgi:predicted small lipoprotein YifL
MIRTLYILLMLSAAVWLGGCAAKGPTYFEARAQAHAENTATVYVFRKYAEPTAWGATVFYADKEIATLNQGGFTWAYLAPGKQTIRAVWPGLSSQKDSSIELNVAAGKTYYVELLGVARGFASPTMTSFRVGSGLIEVSPSSAEETLAQCCRFQKSIEKDH